MQLKSAASRGASLLEMLFAILIVALAMPFAYRQVSSIGAELKIMSAAKEIAAGAESARNFMRLYPDEFPDGRLIQVETDEEGVVMFVSNVGGDVTAFIVVQNHRGDILAAHKIANIIGADAAVIEPDGMAYSPHGNWAITIPGGENGDIIYRVKAPKTGDGTQKYLHRTVLSEGDLTTMKRDLSMGGFSVVNANGVFAKKLTASDFDAHLVRAAAIAANALYFAGGLNLNPEKSKIPNMRVNGDAIGFRNFNAGNFASPAGAVTADRAVVARKLIVSKKFEVKSPYSRVASGFAGVSAGNVRTAYLDADTLTFMPGFGLTVSGELLYSATPPIKIGTWSFPNSTGAGPRMSVLKLGNFGGRKVDANVPDFADILREGWR